MSDFRFFVKTGIRFSASKGGKLRILIPDALPLDLKEKAVELARNHKAAIMHMLAKSEPGQCELCRRAGYWDYRDYGGKLLCFDYAFRGQSGKPVPCSEV